MSGWIVKYLYNIGDRIVNEKMDITILDRKYAEKIDENGYRRRTKYYRYKCNKCGFDCGVHYKNGEQHDELWVIESTIKYGKHGCACCTKDTDCVVPGIKSLDCCDNFDIVSQSFKGGKEEAKKYTKSSNHKIYPVCRFCGKISNKPISISDIYYRGYCCEECNDGISYGEKFILNLLKLSGIDFIWQFSSHDAEWVGKYKYDFYFNYKEDKYIIEVHGIQHYEPSRKFNRTLKEEQENDFNKKQLAIKNGYNYIEIDSRVSYGLDNIKTSIINSGLLDIIGLAENKINWSEIHKKSLNSLIVEACKIWKEDKLSTVASIAKELKLNRHTVGIYLDIGSKLGLCNYDKEKIKYDIQNNTGRYANPIKCITTGDIFENKVKAVQFVLPLLLHDGIVYKESSAKSILNRDMKLGKYVFEKYDKLKWIEEVGV